MTSQKKEIIEVPGLGDPADSHSYVQCVTAGDWVFVSGQAGVDEEFDPVALDFEPQARRAFENVMTALEAAGSSLEDVVHMTVWLGDLRYVDDFVEILAELLGLPADLLETTVPGAERAYYIGQDGYKMEGRFIQPGVDAMVETGYLEETIDMSGYVTNDYIPDDADQFPPFIEG